MMRRGLSGAILFCCGVGLPAGAADPDPGMLGALRPFHGLVGTWKGKGESQWRGPAGKSAIPLPWDETIICTWGFRDDGRVSLNFRVEGKGTLRLALLTFDPQKECYVFRFRDAEETDRQYEGKAEGSDVLRVSRVDDGVKDGLDRVEIKLARGGDKLLYALAARRGRTFFDNQVWGELFREGFDSPDWKPLADYVKEGPHCPVTGGAGRVAVEYKGQTYFVACESTAKEFLRQPEKYLAAAKSP